MVSEAILRFEVGLGAEVRPGVRMLSPRETAFALSLALSNNRDPGLLTAAAQGKLTTHEEVAATVRQILDDPKVPKSRVLGFFREHFDYYRAPEVFKDPLPDYFGRRGIGHSANGLVADTDLLVVSVLARADALIVRKPSEPAAKAGDLIFVSGAIGDGLLGLMALRDQIPGIAAEDRDALGVRYRLPQPRLALGVALTERGLSRCAIDVSDGLVADLGHIARQSQLAAEIRADKVPLSSAARRAIEGDPSLLLRALTGGDDYELLFTVAPDKRDAVAGLARELDLPLTEIGSMKWGEDVRVVDAHGRALTLGDSGWRHF